MQNKECFEKFARSRAHEPESDPDIWVARCEAAGIERTYFGFPNRETVKKVCAEECPFIKREVTAHEG